MGRSTTDSGGPSPSGGGSLLVLLLLAGMTIWAFRDVPSLQLTDIDGPTLLRVSRVDDLRQLPHLVSMEFRDDPKSGAGFYRPLTSLSFAIDQWIFGGRIAPMHVVDILLHVATGLALFGLARALGLGAWPALLAAACLLLHPLAAEVVPSLARRGESLAMLLVAASLTLEARGRGRWALSVALLAPLAKESGFLVLFVLPLAAGRWDWRRTLELGAGLTIVALLRSAVVGAPLGGYEEMMDSFGDLPRALLDLLDGGRLLGLWGARLWAVAFLVLAYRARRQATLRVGALWLASALALTQFSSGLGAWYLYAALPGIALMMAAICAEASRVRWAALVALALAIAGSPAWTDYPEWREADRWLRRVREELLRSVGPRFEGPLIVAGLPAHSGQGPGHRFHLRSVNVALGWTLRDAIHLETGRSIEVFGAGHVLLDRAPAEFRLRAERVGDRLRLRLEGSAQFTPEDLKSEGFGQRELPFRAEARRGELELWDLSAPCRYWDGDSYEPCP